MWRGSRLQFQQRAVERECQLWVKRDVTQLCFGVSLSLDGCWNGRKRTTQPIRRPSQQARCGPEEHGSSRTEAMHVKQRIRTWAPGKTGGCWEHPRDLEHGFEKSCSCALYTITKPQSWLQILPQTCLQGPQVPKEPLNVKQAETSRSKSVASTLKWSLNMKVAWPFVMMFAVEKSLSLVHFHPGINLFLKIPTSL